MRRSLRGCRARSTTAGSDKVSAASMNCVAPRLSSRQLWTANMPSPGMESVPELLDYALEMHRQGERPEAIAHALLEKTAFSPDVSHMGGPEGIVLRFRCTGEVIRFDFRQWSYEPGPLAGE